jgi:hypothetical protein
MFLGPGMDANSRNGLSDLDQLLYFGEWRVCRLSGWNRDRLCYPVIVVRVRAEPRVGA